jgi:uncharacterized protein YbcC (UPF0753/DUF2309 family)
MKALDLLLMIFLLVGIIGIYDILKVIRKKIWYYKEKKFINKMRQEQEKEDV